MLIPKEFCRKELAEGAVRPTVGKRVRNRMKGKGKVQEGVVHIPSTLGISSKELLGMPVFSFAMECLYCIDCKNTSAGTWTAMFSSDEQIKDLLERSEDVMRDVGVRLNELSMKVLELEGIQAMIRRILTK